MRVTCSRLFSAPSKVSNDTTRKSGRSLARSNDERAECTLGTKREISPIPLYSESILGSMEESHTRASLFIPRVASRKTRPFGHRFARLAPSTDEYVRAAVNGNSQRGIRGGTWPSRRRRRGAHLRRGPALLVSRPSCRPSSPPSSANASRRLPRELLASRTRTQSPLGDPNIRPARPRCCCCFCFSAGWPRFGIVRDAIFPTTRSSPLLVSY